MIVKYFHYHVGSYVSKNTRGGDTIRLLIKLIVMENTTHLEDYNLFFFLLQWYFYCIFCIKFVSFSLTIGTYITVLTLTPTLPNAWYYVLESMFIAAPSMSKGS